MILVLLHSAVFGQTATEPAIGNGGPGSPYEIASWENLYWLSQNSGEWNKHFVQMANITFPADINTWNGGSGWTPIGNNSTRFTGSYDGGGFTISNLYINRSSTDYQGLFGRSDGATISNLGLFNLSVAGRNRIGGLIGDAVGGTVDNVFVEGAITGGTDAIGGLIGHTTSPTEISQSFTVGTVNASGVSIGGLVGGNLGKIENSFSLSAVTVSGSDNRIGGLVGHNFGGEIIRSFSAGAVSASNGGGLVGRSDNGASITDSYWDNQTSTKTSSAGGTGLNTTQMRQSSNFTNWDFTNDWKMSSTFSFNGYPVLEWTKSYPEEPSIVNGKRQIEDLANLLWMTDATSRWGDDYEQTADIDMIIVRLWDEGRGWRPTGSSNTQFSGSYDGDGHTISNLYINDSGLRHAGLFGFAENATFKNLTITGSITADWDVGGLVGQANGSSLISNVHTDVDITVRESGGGIVGHNQGVVENSSAAGNITGSTGNNMGGLVAYHNGGTIKTSLATGNVTSSNGGQVGGLVGAMLNPDALVENSYATGTVSASNNPGNGGAGGLIGRIRDGSSTVTNSYSTGAISGSGPIGGLIGVRSSSTVTNSFWDNQTSNQTSSDGGTGNTTAQMQTLFTFTDSFWDFTCEGSNGTEGIWGYSTEDNGGYPWLAWQGFDSQCAEWIGEDDGNWNDASNWFADTVPGEDDAVIIPSDNQPNISDAGRISALQVRSGSSLILSEGQALTVLVNIDNQGTIHVESGGMFNNQTGTPIEITAQRDLATAGWTYLSSPVSGVHLSSFLAPTWTQGLTDNPGSGNTDFGIPNVYRWKNDFVGNEPSGWEAVTDLDAVMENGEGFLVGVFEASEFGGSADLPHILSVTGTEHGNFLLETNANEGGWTFIGNPYPTAISFGMLRSSANITDAVYVWTPDGGGNLQTDEEEYNEPFESGSWASFAIGNGNGGAGELTGGRIAPFQAFFVENEASSSSVQLDFNNTIKSSDAPLFLFKEQQRDVIRMELAGQGMRNSTWLSFSADGTLDRRTSGDAWQLQPMSTDYALLATEKPDVGLLDIGHYPASGEIEIPLITEVTRAGTYRITVTDLDLHGRDLYLVDLETGDSLLLKENLSYEFTIHQAEKVPADPFAMLSNDPRKVSAEPHRFMISTNRSDGVDSRETPAEIALWQNYPNPFNPTTQITYELPRQTEVTLQVFDMTGRHVATLVNEQVNAGTHTVNFDATNLSSGVYMYRLQAGSQVMSRKLTLIK